MLSARLLAVLQDSPEDPGEVDQLLGVLPRVVVGQPPTRDGTP